MPADDDIESIEVRLFLEAIAVRYGYDLRGYAPTSIHRRVLAALAKSGLPHVGELQHRVLTDPTFFESIVDQMTVQVSEMFRDPSQYRELRAQVLPVLRTYPLLKIWHAGCSSGEEAYASAILLTEAGLYDRCQIYATDLSAKALDQAKQGVYPESLREKFANNYQQAGGTRDFASYCTEAYGCIAMNESLRRNILFFQHNLVSDHVFGEMHVVFCRNVLIYFGAELRARVLGNLTTSLCAGGFLCLGGSESLRPGEMGRFSDLAPESHIYRHAAIRASQRAESSGRQ